MHPGGSIPSASLCLGQARLLRFCGRMALFVEAAEAVGFLGAVRDAVLLGRGASSHSLRFPNWDQ